MTPLDNIVCFGALFGFLFIFFSLGEVGNSNIFRSFMLLYSFALTGGYAAQYWWEGKELDFIGFPLTGIFCWGMIGVFQILHIRLNIQRRKRLEEYRNMRF